MKQIEIGNKIYEVVEVINGARGHEFEVFAKGSRGGIVGFIGYPDGNVREIKYNKSCMPYGNPRDIQGEEGRILSEQCVALLKEKRDHGAINNS